MPRRTGRDHVRPKDPRVREIAEAARMERQRRSATGTALDHIVAPVRAEIGVGPMCIHNVHWKDCLRCSKPVKR